MKMITPSRFRLIVQAVFALFCVYVGFRFAGFLAWTLGQAEVFVARPGAVEGFLPIGALLALRQLLATGEWDMVHPAGLTILLAILVMAFLFRKGFCAYICPVGFLSGLLSRVGRRCGLDKVPPRKLDLALTGVKYFGLGFFGFTVFLFMDLDSVQAFLRAPYNMVADAKMLAFFTNPSALSLTIIVALGLLSLVVRNPWCRYLCPYGALLGLFSWFSPTVIVRDEASCVSCGKCTGDALPESSWRKRNQCARPNVSDVLNVWAIVRWRAVSRSRDLEVSGSHGMPSASVRSVCCSCSGRGQNSRATGTLTCRRACSRSYTPCFWPKRNG
jgi:polyferredoxin